MHKKMQPFLLILFAFLLSFVGFPIKPANAAISTNYVTATKSVNPSTVTVGGETEVTLNIQGTPPINVVKPNDVILIIDKSGSMGVEKMNSAKDAAKGFIDLMDFSKHQVGIVDFSTNVGAFNLTTDKQSAKNYIDTLVANGGTNTGSAIQKATELLANHRPDAQPVIVLLTDGQATGAGDGLNAFDYTLKKALEAKDAGIVFYTIALLNTNEDPLTSAPNILMKNMATTSHHHHFILGSVGLKEIYAAIVQEIGLASAYDVIVKDIIAEGFEIVPGSYDNNIPKPVVEGNSLTWKFLELKKDILSFTYKIRHTGSVDGTFPVSKGSTITYKDYTGVTRNYDIPSVNVVVKYPAPKINQVTPSKGLITGGEAISIKGENFLPNAKVYLNGQLASNIQVISGTEINAVTPPGTQGTAQLKVVNTDAQFATADFLYYGIPEITSISPNNGFQTGGTTVIVKGKNFLPEVKVKFGENYSTMVTYNNNGSLYVISPPSSLSGPVDVTIENPDGYLSTLKNAFTYNESPKITLSGIAPATGILTGNESVVLTGKEFKTGVKVYFNNVEAPSVTLNSSERLTVKTPAWVQPEVVDVKAVNADGTESILSKAYSYEAPPAPPAPSILSITPNQGRRDTSQLVVIDGKDFVKGAKVVFGGTAEVQTEFITATRLRLTTPLWSVSGPVDIQVVNPDGQSTTQAQGYTFQDPPALPDPVITKLSQTKGPMSGNTMIYVDGTGFQNGLKLYWISNGAEKELSVEYINSNRVRIFSPVSTTPGSVDIKIVNPDNKSVSMPNAFAYDAPPVFPDPVLTSVSPNSGTIKGGNVVDLIGNEFQKNAKVSFGSTQIDLYAFVDKTRVKVVVPASTTEGTVDIIITNPDGKSSTLSNAYTYLQPKPAVTKVTPGNGPLAGGTLVIIDGVNFESGLSLTFNGQAIKSEYINSTRIRFTTPAGNASGPVDIILTNPSGSSATCQFTYDVPPPVAAPKLTKLLPNSGPVAGGTLLYLDGANIKSGAVVVWDGVTYTAEFINNTRLRIFSPKGSAIGAVPVKIVNPDGQESGTLNFEYK
ncbi:IPT/TIG domain-containing protein [Paenibacillus sp. GbtcB18]|uniref:IPT/TIG domain-containing protein n=1 Tax=Paenibacillus sp. GbtcB18 TaxID=2824763 RepID=UPI001C2F942F|nr:IPT/TIG domain-containing protein [Paenibacillus sp. GbtcB18]